MHSHELITKDKHRISFVHHKQGHAKLVVLVHGFFNNKDVHLFKEIAKEINQYYDVVTFDLRGHGKSSGLFSWTSKECLDLQTVLEYVKGSQYQDIALMGFSLGAAISIIEASRDSDIKTVIAVSSPSDFWKVNFHFWETGMLKDLKLNLGVKGKGKGIRPGNPFEKKIAPIGVVDKISPRSILFIHGNKDWLIQVEHSQELYRKAKEPKKLVIIDNGGHAEKMFDEAPKKFIQVCLDWLKENL